jgi:hypothetical protein
VAFIIIDLADKRKVKCSCGIGTVTVLLQSINRDAGILRIGSIFMAHAVGIGSETVEKMLETLPKYYQKRSKPWR